MPARTRTALDTIVHLPSPDGRVVDFSKSAESPHAVRITVPKGSSHTTSGVHWNEEFKVVLTCVEGRIHSWIGTGPYSNVDRFWGGGDPSNESYAPFEYHYWQREDVTRSRSRQAALRNQAPKSSDPGYEPDLEKGESDSLLPLSQGDDVLDRDLVIEIRPDSNYWAQHWGDRHEVFYRNHISMERDAGLYPSLPDTPILIRLLFNLPRFLFPAVLRDMLIAWLLSVQLLVLYSARVDHHPDLGSPPIMFLYALFHFPKYWAPFAPQMPQWVSRWQWNTIMVVSHFKVAFWSGFGKRLLGMKATYPEYTPERLKDALNAWPGEVE
jgi:hypothetical protein